MLMVATITKLAGIPIADSAVMMVALITSTTSAARIGSSVSSLPMVSRVRRAIVNAPRPMAAPPSSIPWSIGIAPLPTSGATAFATFDAPAENAM